MNYMAILILGGSGGIGQALIHHFLSSRDTPIYATYRSQKPDIQHCRLKWFKADASSEQDLCALATQIPPLTLLINAIGLLHDSNHRPEKSISQFDSHFFEQNLRANTLPTLLLAKHFSLHLKSNQPTHFIALSARIGSISDNRAGGWISYRCSKAALNMALKTISIEWQYKLPNCCIIGFHPGTTDTGLSKPFQKNVVAERLFTAEYVAHCLDELLPSLSAEHSGRLFSYDGQDIPW